MSERIRGDDLIAAGLEPGPVFGVALRVMPRAAKRLGREEALRDLAAVVAAPAEHLEHAYFGDVAAALGAQAAQRERTFVERDAAAPYADYCPDADPGARAQMQNALRLPSAVRGALMPDAHVGYGLPIGGVLATEDAVIPYAVGVDIACRMKLQRLRRCRPRRRRRPGGRLERVAACARRPSASARSVRRATAATTRCWTHDWTLTRLTARPARARRGAARHVGLGQPLRRVRDAHARRARPRPRGGSLPGACSRTRAAAARARTSPATTRKLARELPPRAAARTWRTSRGSTSTTKPGGSTGPR